MATILFADNVALLNLQYQKELGALMLINARRLVVWVERKSADDFATCFNVLTAVVIELVEKQRAPKVLLG